MGAALNIYTSEFGAYPRGEFPISTNQADMDSWWLIALQRNSADSLYVFFCPQPQGQSQYGGIYFYNSNGTGYSIESKLSFGLAGIDRAVNESDVKMPSEMIALGDSQCSRIVGFGWPGIPAGLYSHAAPHPTRRSNAVFCDGHVESSASDLITKDEAGEFRPDEIHTRRWNYDFETHPETWW
jgi:prepilin-type processing-associated H-X9-DG protein